MMIETPIPKTSDSSPISDLPPQHSGRIDMSAASLDAGALAAVAQCICDLWPRLQAETMHNSKLQECFASMMWLQLDLCEAFKAKIDQLDDTYKLVERKAG